jgi:hypothetical protein
MPAMHPGGVRATARRAHLSGVRAGAGLAGLPGRTHLYAIAGR